MLGFSGGIDSVTAVGLLRKQGLSVTTLMLDMMGDEKMLQAAATKAAKLDIKHIIKDVRDDFTSNIIEYFLSEYTAGRTPAPCTMCNPLIKWRPHRRRARGRREGVYRPRGGAGARRGHGRIHRRCGQR